MTGVETRGPGRPRKEVVAQERRRRSASTLDRNAQMKLAVPESVRQNNPGQSFRWINDHGTRMFNLTEQDDWSKVDDVEPIPVGTDNFGKPVMAYLCKKPQEFMEADSKEKIEATRETERAIMRGQRAAEDSRTEGESYVPSGNSIRDGYQP